MNRRIARKIRKQWDHWNAVLTYHHTVHWNKTMGPAMNRAVAQYLGQEYSQSNVQIAKPLVVPKPIRRLLQTSLITKAYSALPRNEQSEWFMKIILARQAIRGLDPQKGATALFETQEHFIGAVTHFLNELNAERELKEDVLRLCDRDD